MSSQINEYSLEGPGIEIQRLVFEYSGKSKIDAVFLLF